MQNKEGIMKTAVRFVVHFAAVIFFVLGSVACGGGGDSDASSKKTSLDVTVNGVSQQTSLAARIGASATLVDAEALAAMVPDLSFYGMLNPPIPGMVLQYGRKISFVSAGFAQGFASAVKVDMDSPLQIDEGVYWTPLNFLADAMNGTVQVNDAETVLELNIPAASEIGDRVAEAAAVAQELDLEFAVRQGEIALTNAIDMYTAGYMPDCNGNNADNPYLVTQNPISPRAGVFNRLPLGFYLDQDEAFVCIGYTPPQCVYFSYQHYLMNRYYSDEDPSVRKIYARLGDSINNYNITGYDTPFNQLFVLVICANQDTYDRIERAAVRAGIDQDKVHCLVLPSDTVRFGLDQSADALTFLHRVALFTRDSDKNDYLNQPPLELLRVTPRTALVEDPMTPLDERQRQTFVLEHDISGLRDVIEDLQDRIIATHSPDYAYWKILMTGSWMYPGGESAIASGTNVLGETSDTLYLKTRKFILHDDDLIVAFGAMHNRTGKGVYANVSCYGAEALNGIGGITSASASDDTPGRRSYADTGKNYLPDADRDDQLSVYAYKFARIASDNSTFAIPTNEDNSYQGFNDGDRVFMGFRIYVDNSTTVGPFPGSVTGKSYFAYPGVPDSEVFFDQAILFSNHVPDVE